MRSKIVIVSLLIVLAVFAINAHSIYDSAGKSADQLIDESNGIFIHDSSIPENPQAARKLWTEERGINFTMPSKLSGNSMSPEESRSSVKAGEGIQYQTVSTTQTPSTQEASSSPSTTGMAGSWSFELRDSKTRILALTLFQSEDAVFGTGSMNDGGDTLEVSASGSIEGDKLNLDVTSSQAISLYRLALLTNGGSASGDYKAFSTSGAPWTGIAKGLRSQTQN